MNVSNLQLRIAFGKYVAGYRPGDEGWTPEDQETLDLVQFVADCDELKTSTPPEQDELERPIAAVDRNCMGYLKVIDTIQFPRVPDGALLYTHPQSDRLRKAAERTEKVMRNSGYTVLADYLRAALEEDAM